MSDHQRQQCYRAEREVRVDSRYFTTRPHVRQFVQHVSADDGGGSFIWPEVSVAFSRAAPTARGGRYKDGWGICLTAGFYGAGCDWSWSTLVILHELAHVQHKANAANQADLDLSWNERHEGHGSLWAATFVKLVARHMGMREARELAGALIRHDADIYPFSWDDLAHKGTNPVSEYLVDRLTIPRLQFAEGEEMRHLGSEPEPALGVPYWNQRPLSRRLSGSQDSRG